jgi:hypothetical protein
LVQAYVSNTRSTNDTNDASTQTLHVEPTKPSIEEEIYDPPENPNAVIKNDQASFDSKKCEHCDLLNLKLNSYDVIKEENIQNIQKVVSLTNKIDEVKIIFMIFFPLKLTSNFDFCNIYIYVYILLFKLNCLIDTMKNVNNQKQKQIKNDVNLIFFLL